MSILGFLIFGLVVGLIARLLMPGRQAIGMLGTMLLGIGGSLLGGVLGNLIGGARWDHPITAGWIGSVLGSLLLLALISSRRRSIFH
jgi:uncharacterized membrane protein YeaQ/YmgE (transglycosylase-associated protein family)